MASESNYVQALADHLQDGLAGLTADTVAVVWGVNDRYVFGNRALALKQIGQILADSGRVFVHDGCVVFEQRSETDGKRLVPLMQGDRLAREAPAHLAGLFFCAVGKKDGPATCQPP